MDEPNKDGITPVLLVCCSGRSLDLISWLIEQGASAVFEEPYFHSALAYVALNKYNSLWKEPPEKLRAIAAASQPERRDQCRCYCSKTGCSSLNMLFNNRNWTFGLRPDGPIPRHCRSETLERWCEILGSSQDDKQVIYLEFCRLEVFERLGMAHTCCIEHFSPWIAWTFLTTRTLRSEDEVNQMQEEDEESLQHLELIMEAYRFHHATTTASLNDFWTQWWHKIDRILPEPEERKWGWYPGWKFRGYDYRLCSNVYGYDGIPSDPLPLEYKGLDFVEVIKRELFDVDCNITASKRELRLY